LAVDAVLRLKGNTDLQMIHIIKKLGAGLEDSFLDDGFILEKKIGVGQPKSEYLFIHYFIFFLSLIIKELKMPEY
jgi:chaperonin GroEL (HSP60 family)